MPGSSSALWFLVEENMNLSHTIKQIIDLAEAVQNYWDEELPKRHPSYPLVGIGEDSGPPPPEEKKLKELFSRLPEEAIYKVLLLMYLGRGDFDTADLSADYKALKRRYSKPEEAVAQMIEKASLAEYLTEGMAELNRNGFDIENLTLSGLVQR